jgi:cell wall integrity and stress response component
MVYFRRLAPVLVAASMMLMAVVADNVEPPQTVKNPITTPTVTLAASAMTEIGCFETGIPLENHGHYNFRSPGNCQLVCLELGKDVMGLSDGVNCWCGDMIPPKAAKTLNTTCSTTCSGDDTTNCKLMAQSNLE